MPIETCPYHEAVKLRILSLPLGLVVLTGCSVVDDAPFLADEAPPVTLESNIVAKAKDVTVDTVVRAKATDGRIDSATLYYGEDPAENPVKGAVSGTEWIASELLEPAQTYHLFVTGENAEGKQETLERTFRTHELTLAQQTYPSVAPLQGERVGVGMPVIVKFDIPVENKAIFERKMRVSSTPAVEGSWSWLNDREVHFRPKDHWPAGAKVRLIAAVNGLPAGNGIYGQQDQDISFTIGRSVVSTVDIARHTLRVKIDGKTARTFGVTTGKDGFITRSGTKVVMEKHKTLRMDSSTIGIDEDDPEYYDLPDVKQALRVTNSGEFIHAAPWSQGSQGLANVSHGCVGLSVGDANWFFSHSTRGDVVNFTGSSRSLEAQNGWTDWDVPYDEFKKGSAL